MKRRKGASTIISSVKGTGYQKEYGGSLIIAFACKIDLRSEIANAHSASVVDAKKKKFERKKKKTLPLLCSSLFRDRAIKKIQDASGNIIQMEPNPHLANPTLPLQINFKQRL